MLLPENQSHPGSEIAKASKKPVKRTRKLLASWTRWLHIYLSMFGLAVILFFSITGLTLNHPDWFFQERTVRSTGTLNAKWLNTGGMAPADWDENDYSHQISKLEVAEFLRAENQLRGKVTDFLAFQDECEVTFQGPGYAATARIARASGDYTLDVTANDFVTVINDLHKGRNTGHAWSWIIDISAVIGTLVAVSGFVLIFFLRMRRRTGIITAAVGTLALWLMYRIATA